MAQKLRSKPDHMFPNQVMVSQQLVEAEEAVSYSQSPPRMTPTPGPPVLEDCAPLPEQRSGGFLTFLTQRRFN